MTRKTDLTQLINRSGSERALLAICLNNPQVVPEVMSSGLEPSMFAVPGHKFIYMAINYLVVNDKPVDPVSITTVYSSEDAKSAIDDLGGLDYLDALQESELVPNTDLYIGHIKQAAARRQIVERARKLEELAMRDEDTELERLLANAENEFREISLKFSVDQGVYKIGDNLADRLKERATNPDPVPGLAVGWRDFDLATGGLKKGELTIVAARTKVGKSVTCLNWAKKIAIDDKIPVLYIDTEMQEWEQEDRLLAMIAEVPHDEIVSGMFVKDNFESGKGRDKVKRIQEATKKIRHGKLFHISLPDFTPEKIWSLVKKYQIKEGIQMVVFDYIKIPSASAGNVENGHLKLAALTSTLKDIATTLELTVVSAVQLNRTAVGQEEYDDSMIAGSDGILQLASRLCFLRNKTEAEYATEGGATAGNQKFQVAFQRGGGSNLDPFNIQFDRKIIRQRQVSNS
ncbi:hypothetical protein EG878_14630 [Enterococcus faecalis]|nr:hypothetical protein EG878_14630 [Enterococcus faecalis]